MPPLIPLGVEGNDRGATWGYRNRHNLPSCGSECGYRIDAMRGLMTEHHDGRSGAGDECRESTSAQRIDEIHRLWVDAGPSTLMECVLSGIKEEIRSFAQCVGHQPCPGEVEDHVV